MFVERPHGRLFYEVVEPRTGAGAGTVVFLHGVAVTHEVWRDWHGALADHRLLLIDVRGFGRSAGMGGIDGWTLDDLSDDVLAVADHAGAEVFHAVGESSGGTAVLNLACRGLGRLRTATAVSAAHRGGHIDRVKRWRTDLDANGMAWWSAEMMQRRFLPGALTDRQFARFKAMQDASPAEPVLRLGELLLGTDLTPARAGITCPLLLIVPDRSPFVTPEVPLEVLNAVPTASLSVVPASRHGIVYSHAAYCARLVADLVAG